MTVSTTAARIDYAGNGVTTAFAVPYPFFASADLRVLSVNDTTGVQTLLSLGTNYTVAGGGGGTGTVTMTVAPATGTTLSIQRATARTQSTDYVDFDAFPASAHESALDRLTLIAQEIDTTLQRGLRTQEGDPLPGLLPNKAARAGLFLAFDSSGNPIAAAGPSLGGVTVSSFMGTVLDDASADAARTTLGAAATSHTHLAADISDSGATGRVVLQAATQATARSAINAASLAANTFTALQTIQSGGLDVQAGGIIVDGGVTVDTGNLTVSAGNLVVSGTATIGGHAALRGGASATTTLTGTSVDFTGIPAGVRRIVVSFRNASLNGISNIQVQLGAAGGVETSGYTGVISQMSGSANSDAWPGAGALVTRAAAAADLHTGVLTLTRHDATSNVWTITSFISRDSSTHLSIGAKALAGTLDRIRITSVNGTDTFDSGSVIVLWEL